MPSRKRPSKPAQAGIAGGPVKSFRQRYNDLEKSRAALLERLERHAQAARTHPPSLSLRRDGRAEPKHPWSEGWHPSVKRARRLLTATFRSASVAQRTVAKCTQATPAMAILQAAEWLICLIEKTPPAPPMI